MRLARQLLRHRAQALSTPRIRRICPVHLSAPQHHLSSSQRLTAIPIASMSSVKTITTDKIATPIAPYSPATVANGLVFCSGQVPIDLNAKIIDGSITDMTRQCIHNLKAVLEAAGSSIEKVTKTTIFVTDMKTFAEVNEEYGKHFTHRPARSTIGVAALPLGAQVEIECIALA